MAVKRVGEIRLSPLACLRDEVRINGWRILRRTVNDFSLWRLIEYPTATRMLGLHPGEWVLDIGSGTSSYPWMLARRGARVVIAELDEERVRWQQEKARAWKVAERVLAVVADATALPFREGVFDRVTAVSAIEHIPDDRAVAREIARVLRPGGKAVISVPYTFHERTTFFSGIRDFRRIGRNEFVRARDGGLVRFYTDEDVEERFGEAVGCRIVERRYFGRTILNDWYHETRLTRYWHTWILKDLPLACWVHPFEERFLRKSEPFGIIFCLEKTGR